MSTKPYKGFEPKWVLTRAPENSYRSIFRWGDPEFFKYPKESLYNYVKSRCGLNDDDFRQYNDDIGMEPVELGKEYAPKISKTPQTKISEWVSAPFKVTLFLFIIFAAIIPTIPKGIRKSMLSSQNALKYQ